MSNKTANGATKTRKTAAAMGRKRSGSTGVKGNAANASEPRTGAAGTKRKKPFVL